MRIFIAPGLVKGLKKINPHISQASTNFYENLYNTKSFDFMFLIAPVDISNINAVSSAHKFIHFVNKLYLRKSLLKYLGVFGANIAAFKAIRRVKPSAVWVYNINNTNILLHFLLLTSNIKSFLILADRFYYKNSLLKFIEKRVFLKQSGAILLSEGFLKIGDIKNYKIMEGVIPSRPAFKHDNIAPSSQKIIIFFAGLLSYKNGIGLLLDFIKSNTDDNLQINICGINYENIDFAAVERSNVKYYGTVEYDLYKELLNTADICLSLRDPGNFENNFEFPSKIFEFYLQNKIIISTYNYTNVAYNKMFYSEFEVGSLQNTMKSVVNNFDSIRRYDADYRLYNKFNLEAWHNSIAAIEEAK